MPFKNPDFAVAPYQHPMRYDTFNRTNSTTTPGALSGVGPYSTAASWTVENGTFGINNNALYKTATDGSPNQVTINLETAFQDVRAIFTGTGIHGIVFRWVDANNHMLFQIVDPTAGAGRTWYLYKKIAGVYTQVATGTVTVVADRYFRVLVNLNGYIELWHGISLLTWVSPGGLGAIPAGTRAGIEMYTLAGRTDYFWATANVSPEPAYAESMDITWNDTYREVGNFSAWRVYRRHPEIEAPWKLIHTRSTTAAEYLYSDYSWIPGRIVEYQVRQFWTNGTEATDAVINGGVIYPQIPKSEKFWLIHPTNNAYNVRLESTTAHSYTDEDEQTELVPLNRGRKTDYGTYLGPVGTLTCLLRDVNGGLTARQQRLALQALIAEKTFVYLRNPFGDLWVVALGDITFDRTPGLGTHEMATVTIPYEQVA